MFNNAKTTVVGPGGEKAAEKAITPESEELVLYAKMKSKMAYMSGMRTRLRR